MRLASIVFSLCLALSALLVPPAAAEDDKVMLNFVNVDIESVAKAVGQISGRNFLVDPRVKGTVNIVSSSVVPRDMVYDVFLSALRLQGFTAVEADGVTKLIPEADAKFQSSVTSDVGKARGNKLVTHVFTMKHDSAAVQIVPVLRPLISPIGTITSYSPSRSLVITDYADNIKRLQKVIESVDQPGNLSLEIIPLHRASAVEVVQTIRVLLGESSSELGQKTILLPDLRSNSLLVRADSDVRLAQIKEFAAKLDKGADMPGTVHVVLIKNAEAVKLAETLKNIISTIPLGGGSSPAIPAAGAEAKPVSAAAANGGGASGSVLVANGISIQAETSMNALIITAPDAIFNNLRAVIDILDTRRSQVYVEALVVELNSDKAAEFGVQWQNLGGFSGGGRKAIVGGSNFGGSGQNIIAAATNLATLGRGLSIGVMNGTVRVPGVGAGGAAQEITSLGVLARMLESTGSANILSTPNLMTIDNEEAKLSVGQNIPIVTGNYTQALGAATSPFQTIERKDIGLLLKIKPQISDGGAIRMRIYQEVSSVVAASDSTLAAAQGVTTNKRSVDTNVLVDDGEIIVIGGLIQDNFQNQRDQVPFLGDIPLLGGLFRYDTKRHIKTNLMVFIRPTVIKNIAGYNAVTTDQYQAIRAEQSGQVPKNSVLLPDERGAVIPPLKGSKLPSSPIAPTSP